MPGRVGSVILRLMAEHDVLEDRGPAGSGEHTIDHDERRRLTRVPVQLPVAVELADGTVFPAKISDVGVGGGFIESADAPGIGTETTLVLFVDERLGLVRIPARVRWVTGNGFGIQFSRLDSEATRALLRLVESGRVDIE